MATALRKAQSSVARWTVEAANVRNAGGVSARNRSTLWLRLAAAGAMLAAAVACQAQTRSDAAGAPPAWRVVLMRSWDSLYPVNVIRVPEETKRWALAALDRMLQTR